MRGRHSSRVFSTDATSRSPESVSRRPAWHGRPSPAIFNTRCAFGNCKVAGIAFVLRAGDRRRKSAYNETPHQAQRLRLGGVFDDHLPKTGLLRAVPGHIVPCRGSRFRPALRRPAAGTRNFDHERRRSAQRPRISPAPREEAATKRNKLPRLCCCMTTKAPGPR